MPIYEYECEKCGERFECFRSIRDSDNEIQCPKCSSEHIKRVFSKFATGSLSAKCSPTSPT
jgi:putative FmdB family regulatory protein